MPAVMVDTQLATHDASVEALAEAVGPGTRAIMTAHTVGNPFAVATVHELCRENEMRVIEDCCHALGV